VGIANQPIKTHRQKEIRGGRARGGEGKVDIFVTCGKEEASTWGRGPRVPGGGKKAGLKTDDFALFFARSGNVHGATTKTRGLGRGVGKPKAFLCGNDFLELKIRKKERQASGGGEKKDRRL